MLIYPVFIPQLGCPFKCIYCNQTSFGSVTELPPEILHKEIQSFCLAHSDENKQIAFYGGTFTALIPETRDKYYRIVEPFLDEKTTLRISTRPDCVGTSELDWCKSHQVKTIELGIQDFNDEVLAASQRGYDSRLAVEACLRVKQSGFELGIQLMPGLPYLAPTSNQKNIEILQKVLPDFLRIYPLIILRETPLWKVYEAGKIKPLSLDEAIDICLLYSDWADNHNIKIIKFGVPSLEAGSDYVGPYHPAFGELVKGEKLIRQITNLYQRDMTIHISAKDISLLTGHQSYNLRKLKQRLSLEDVKFTMDSSLKAGEIRISSNKRMLCYYTL